MCPAPPSTAHFARAVSSPTPDQVEVAEVLAGKSAGDLRVLKKIALDPEILDDSVGFNAQQAVEKAIKTALTLSAVDFPRTHDLDFLLALAGKNKIDVPAELESSGWLTPWAAEFRYDDAPIESLDRDRAVALAQAAAEWSGDLVSRAKS